MRVGTQGPKHVGKSGNHALGMELKVRKYPARRGIEHVERALRDALTHPAGLDPERGLDPGGIPCARGELGILGGKDRKTSLLGCHERCPVGIEPTGARSTEQPLLGPGQGHTGSARLVQRVSTHELGGEVNQPSRIDAGGGKVRHVRLIDAHVLGLLLSAIVSLSTAKGTGNSDELPFSNEPVFEVEDRDAFGPVRHSSK